MGWRQRPTVLLMFNPADGPTRCFHMAQGNTSFLRLGLELSVSGRKMGMGFQQVVLVWNVWRPQDWIHRWGKLANIKIGEMEPSGIVTKDRGMKQFRLHWTEQWWSLQSGKAMREIPRRMSWLDLPENPYYCWRGLIDAHYIQPEYPFPFYIFGAHRNVDTGATTAVNPL